jgi:two-component system OmpR family response regulator
MSKSILLIDDEPNLAQVIAVCLESFKGWKVQIANSGKAGLSIVESLKPDAILLDVMMPEMGCDQNLMFNLINVLPAHSRV